jgi:hypothetical protein
MLLPKGCSACRDYEQKYKCHSNLFHLASVGKDVVKLPLLLGEVWGEGSSGTAPIVTPLPEPFSQREKGTKTWLRGDRRNFAGVEHGRFDNFTWLARFTEVLTPGRDGFEVFRNPIQNLCD